MPKGKKKSCKALKTSEEGGLSGFVLNRRLKINDKLARMGLHAGAIMAHFGIKPKVDSRTTIFIGGDDKTLSINPQVNTNFIDGGQPDIKAIGVGDLSAACKFTATTYGMIIGSYRDW